MARLSCLILCGLVLSACAVPAARGAEKWLRLASEHFDMLSAAGERDSKQMLVQLEQFRAFFFRTFPDARNYYPRPLIFVFDSNRRFTPYKPLGTDGRPKDVVGVFVDGPVLPRIAMIKGALNEGLSTIFHEYVHALVSVRFGGGVPLWFNEGLATFFQTFEVKGDIAKTGEAIPEYLYILQQADMIPLGTLFAVDYKSKYYNESDSQNVFYAQSWLLVHYSFSGHLGAGRQGEKYDIGNLMRFADKAMLPGAVLPKAFASIYGSGYDKMEGALYDYMHNGEYHTGHATIPAKPILDKITARPATDEEREVELAGARWAATETQAAAAGVLALEQKYPANPRVYETIAEVKRASGEYAAVLEYLRKAVERDSTTPTTYLWLLRRYYNGARVPVGGIMPDDLADKCTKLVDRALELAPDSMEAHEMLALLESQKREMRIKKLNEVMQALPGMADPCRTLLAVATVYCRLRRYGEAESALGEMLKNPRATEDLRRAAGDLQRRIAREKAEPAP